ncbi:hypothetical protein PHELEMICH_66 [Mycobacterium phage Phelemich]|uniref:Uncharacterized protein n=2 Tax=Acadianvirus reprobate TaxID=1982903 RepID=S5YDS2_9CAUD|nr:hypothetical protein N847_gp66 [Mycobacterium phage Phelemich]YP_008409989.1 hypothetical protein REPROBATE_68 [Mycobacterium phage Reprobate]AGT12804.1 hypothetical protein REPROBATE_68 [Mycobacterium phage Reprobate]AGT13980.1 hypothetical protein PHELEMICH_66 [Mycobacterium phage Phelemich]
MMIGGSAVTIDASDLRRLGITRARVDRATACHYRDSGRIIVVADKGDFEAAAMALAELACKVAPTEETTP